MPYRFRAPHLIALLTCLPGANLVAQTETLLAPLEVRAQRTIQAEQADWSPSSSLMHRSLEPDRINPTANLDADWINAGYAAWDANASLGLANGLSIRGFTALPQGASSLQFGRAYINGHPDYLWRFRRDPRTVAKSNLIAGSEATLLGASSPAGALLYTSAQPVGRPNTQVGLSLSSDGRKETFADVERRIGAWESRLILSGETGGRSVERTVEQRSAVLWSNRLPLRLGVGAQSVDLGALRWELEQHIDHSPYVFGTAYVGGKFWFDQPYVDTTRARADRHHRRYALYWNRNIGASSSVMAYLQSGKAKRDETLVGFFDPRPNGTLRGYYREIGETSKQKDQGLRWQTEHRTGSATHKIQAQWQRTEFERNFSGPQSIGGFILQPDQPVWPIDLSALALSPRTTREQYDERAWSAAYALYWGAWSWRSAWRRTQYTLSASASPTLPLAPSAKGSKDIHSTSLSYEWNDQHTSAIAFGQGFLPNRGRLASGEFLPASDSRQWEISHRWQASESTQVNIAAFDLLQTSLAARDPNVPDAFILLGSNRSKGVELGLQAKALGLDWNANLTSLHARIQTPIAATQGRYLTGQPDAYGSITVSRMLTMPVASKAWLRVQGAASRPGDDTASFRAPGYGVWSLGVSSAPGAQTSGWQWQASINNAFDRRYIRALSGADNAWQGERRTLRVALQYTL